MPPSVIIDHLSKQYTLGGSAQESMIRERLVNFLKHPLALLSGNQETIWALRDVSFRVDAGEVVGIIGCNGAGKSTLLKVLSRVTHPTSGMVKVTGRVASLLEVGTGFHEELTGKENIYLNGSILGMKRREVEAKLDAIVTFSGVEKFLDTPIKRYSSGMRLRLGFAVAAHLDPDVLVIDEVLAVGDAGFQKKCLGVMEELRQSGRTVLFVSHNMAAVENLCSRAIWIDSGQVRMDGKAHTVIEAYMAAFSTSQQSASDFAQVENRRGTGEIQYTGLEILCVDGQPLPVLRSGDALILRFHYRAAKPIPHPSFGFRLYTELGTMVTDVGTWHHAIDIPLVPPGKGWIDLEIDLLNLLPARYHLSLWLTGEPDLGNQILYDNLEYCARLDVEASNLFNSGRTFDSRWGVVYFPQRWNLNGIASLSKNVG